MTALSSPQKERRHWPRFSTQEGCLIFESNGAVGEVRDISTGGMGILTIYDLPETPKSRRDGILCCQNILLEKLQFQIVNNSVLPKDYEFSTITKKRYGIRFENLSEMQQKNLEQIIKICAIS